jgi:rod shape-determining protein MreC
MIWGHFWKKYKRFLGYASLFLFPFAALTFDDFRFPKTLFIHKVNSWVVHPTAESIHNSLNGVVYIFKNYVALLKVKQSNDELTKENANLKLKLLQLEEVSKENKRLATLLDLKKITHGNAKVARIIGEDVSPDRFTYLLNLGSRDGIELRSPVLNSDGVIGLIKEVYEHSSVVVTLLDPSSIIDVVNMRSRSHSLLEGTGKEYFARTKYVDRIEDLKVGDLLLSSGIDGIFPENFPVGTIVDVQKPAQGVLQSAFVRPAVDFDKLEEVLILPPLKSPITIRVTTQALSEGSAR